MRIAVIEDDRKLARYLELELGHEGHIVDLAFDGEEGLALAQSGRHDVVVLDIMLPGMSGLDVLRSLRRHLEVPVILLTARDQVSDKVLGLDRGADDYLTKPFAIGELQARIRSIARRIHGQIKDVLRIADLSLDRAERSVRRAGREITLTKREFELLEFLLARAGLPQSRDAILTHVWGYDFYGTTNVVDVYIRQLRDKVDDGFPASLIHTVRGVGYVIRAPRPEDA